MSEQAISSARPTIADILLAHGFVDEERIASALEVSDRTGQPLGQVLVEAGAITRLELASALAEQWSDPDSSITLLPKAAPAPLRSRLAEAPLAPGPAPEAPADEGYLGRLHDAVADLARRVGEAEPLLGEMERRASEWVDPEVVETLETRIGSLAVEVAEGLRRIGGIEASAASAAEQLDALAEGVEQAFAEVQSGTGELAERLAVIASIVDTAPTGGDIAELRTLIHALTARVEEVARAPAVDPSIDARLHEIAGEVAALAARPTTDPEVERKLRQLDARPEGKPELANRVDELATLVESQACAFDAVATELRTAIEEGLSRTVPDEGTALRLDELAYRLGEVSAQVDGLAALSPADGQDVAIDELRGALEELSLRRAGDDQMAARLAELSATVAELAARPPGDPAMAERVDRLGQAVGALQADASVPHLGAALDAVRARADTSESMLAELVRRIEEVSARPAGEPGLQSQLERLEAHVSAALERDDASLAELRAAAAELAARPAGDPELAARLAGLQARVEEIAVTAAAATERPADEGIDELRDGLATLASRLEAVEAASPETESRAWAAETGRLSAGLDALAARVDVLAEHPAAAVASTAPPPVAGQPAAPGGETEQELERLRMAIERMSLHLGEQERAIAEVIRSRGVKERLDELEARIDDVAAGAGGAAAPAAAGSTAPAAAGADVRALIRRLDAAEGALEEERDKLLTKLERIASSLDWRMRRLEAGDGPGA